MIERKFAGIAARKILGTNERKPLGSSRRKFFEVAGAAAFGVAAITVEQVAKGPYQVNPGEISFKGDNTAGQLAQAISENNVLQGQIESLTGQLEGATTKLAREKGLNENLVRELAEANRQIEELRPLAQEAEELKALNVSMKATIETQADDLDKARVANRDFAERNRQLEVQLGEYNALFYPLMNAIPGARKTLESIAKFVGTVEVASGEVALAAGEIQDFTENPEELVSGIVDKISPFDEVTDTLLDEYRAMKKMINSIEIKRPNGKRVTFDELLPAAVNVLELTSPLLASALRSVQTFMSLIEAKLIQQHTYAENFEQSIVEIDSKVFEILGRMARPALEHIQKVGENLSGLDQDNGLLKLQEGANNLNTVLAEFQENAELLRAKYNSDQPTPR